MPVVPKPARVHPDADKIAVEIESAVRDRLTGWVRDFQVVVRDRGIVLKGTTRSYYAKQMVQHASLSASRLPLVANEIQVM